MRLSWWVIAALLRPSPAPAQDTILARPGDTVTVRYVIPATAVRGDGFRVAVLGPNDYGRLFVISFLVVVDSASRQSPPLGTPSPPVSSAPPLPTAVEARAFSSGNAPTFDSTTDLLLVADNFDSWTGVNRRGVPGPKLNVYRDSPVGGGSPPATVSLVSGRSGHGQALRITYPRQATRNAQSRHYVGTEGVSTPTGVSSFQEVWIRTSPGASPDGYSPKWIQHYHPAVPGSSANRIQISSFKFGAGSRSPSGLAGRDCWHVNSLANSLACSRNAPRWRDINDGQWHRFTTEVRAHSARGARDGVARLWIDGLVVVDLSAAGVAAGRTNEAELSQLVYGVPITDIHLGDLLFLGTVATWTMDMDDFRRWRARAGPPHPASSSPRP
jgi:hypothetical protein